MNLAEGDALSKLIYVVVNPNCLALQLKLSLHAHCSEFRKTPSVLLFSRGQDTVVVLFPMLQALLR